MLNDQNTGNESSQCHVFRPVRQLIGRLCDGVTELPTD